MTGTRPKLGQVYGHADGSTWRVVKVSPLTLCTAIGARRYGLETRRPTAPVFGRDYSLVQDVR